MGKYSTLVEEEQEKSRVLKVRMEELELDLERLQGMRASEEKRIERLN